MKRVVNGSFEVTLAPQEIAIESMGRMQIDKTFHGPLEATSAGQMLSASTATKGSAVYVAIERVEGHLDGRSGSFVLYHRGVMDRGQPVLSVSVAPDSGTGELIGLTGSMVIKVESGKHFYEFEYSLADE